MVKHDFREARWLIYIFITFNGHVFGRGCCKQLKRSRRVNKFSMNLSCRFKKKKKRKLARLGIVLQTVSSDYLYSFSKLFFFKILLGYQPQSCYVTCIYCHILSLILLLCEFLPFICETVLATREEPNPAWVLEKPLLWEIVTPHKIILFL